MSKVTIKFWDKEYGEYDHEEWLAIDSNGDIYVIDGFYEGTLNNLYEPHYYKDGKRIA